MEVVSRQRILSRSRDDLNEQNEDDDIWNDVDQLVKEHLHEVQKKWEQIDDGIWAKVIVFERNRRVAKAYVRPPILTINGSDVGFDGRRIGLRGFDNPMRQAKTLEVIDLVGMGVKVRMDNRGSIEVKRLSQYGIYAKPLGEEHAISDEICKTPNMKIDLEKQVVFDIKKFEQNVNREVRRPYPNRAKLESQCIMALSFAKSASILQSPSWVMIINVVAMDMLRSRLPIGLCVKVPSMKNRPRLPVPEEDPYSMTGGGSGTSSGSSSKDKSSPKDKPPKLPPRDSNNTPSNKSSSKGDYDSPEESLFRRFTRKSNSAAKDKDKEKKYDDPYYCGLRARIPNFAKQPPTKGGKELRPPEGQYHYMQQHRPPYGGQIMPNGGMFHSRSVDSGMSGLPLNQHLYKYDANRLPVLPQQPPGYDSDFTESPYAQIYGRLPPPNLPYVHSASQYNMKGYIRDYE